MNGEITLRDCRREQPMTGCKAALAESGAEFYAIRAAFSGSETGVDRLGTEFKDYLAHSIALDQETESQILRRRLAR